ncbi:DUF6361 family protein [Mucilaginibacter flavus]|uniref:DUF6361 family protein n=1 Tax=Mucilaginibacter flavus TaxID=931504 RepID=UPI0025B431F9|nr:DUF6361 family protein [Mucilaginibacter flavus]MDN3585014.1 DUF6361 family protein [Mucilaginibacter flavus]
MNHIGWLDYSPLHHDKVMQVMDMFKETGVIDELGLGTIRDTLSDLFFPGTSTIQTKAKYFLLIPWIIRDIEKSGTAARFFEDLQREEIHFTKILRNNSGNSGVIGATLVNANPKRKPSSIYWTGLKRYNILRFSGSIREYKNYSLYLAAKRKRLKKELILDENKKPLDDRDAIYIEHDNLWSQLPAPPLDWRTNLKIELEYEEAKYLNEKIISSNDKTLWAFALKHCPLEAASFSAIDDFLVIEGLPDQLKTLIKLASDFNSIMQGAVLRYNYLIQLKRESEKADQLETQWQVYLQQMTDFPWHTWNTKHLWLRCPGIRQSTRKFVEDWIALASAAAFSEGLADDLIKKRENKLKGPNRARLSNLAVAQKQDTLTGMRLSDGQVQYLNYRWPIARTFLTDINTGMKKYAAAG